ARSRPAWSRPPRARSLASLSRTRRPSRMREGQSRNRELRATACRHSLPAASCQSSGVVLLVTPSAAWRRALRLERDDAREYGDLGERFGGTPESGWSGDQFVARILRHARRATSFA